MAHLYLSDDVGAAAAGAEITLSGAEARHAATVSRIRASERLLVGDGAGTLAEGVVTAASSDAVTVRLEAVTKHPRPSPRIVLAQALAKGDRDELAVQASTELGVDGILPWEASRSVSRWSGKKRETGVTRWQTIAREASKQSLRAWVPEVTAAHSTREIAGRASEFRLLVLEPTATTRLSAIEPDDRDLMLVVGPEGGITDSELTALQDAGAEIVRLGETVLRTSTAGPAAIAVLSARLDRW